MEALLAVREDLHNQIGRETGPFLVPEFLIGNSRSTRLVDVVDGPQFLVSMIDRLLNTPVKSVAQDSGISPDDRVYLSFPRSFASLNRRIGTSLTQIAFIPYIATHLRPTVFLTLPTGVIGLANCKGTRGSPFAVRNPFAVEPSLADPLLPSISPLRQQQALAEACTLAGMRPGSVITLATLAIDSPLFRMFPDLGYWWRASPRDHLSTATTKTHAAKAGDYIPPIISATDVARFVPPPDPSRVTPITNSGCTFLEASMDDGTSAALANAFPDVVTDDQHTYTWRDVALLRYRVGHAPRPAGVRSNDDFDRTAAAWLLAPAIAAWRYVELGERVLWVDVGPSIPDEILMRARRLCRAWPKNLSQKLEHLGAGLATPPEADTLLEQLAELIGTSSDHRANLCFIAEELWEFEVSGSIADAVSGPLSVCVGAHGHTLDTCVESLRYHLHQLATPSVSTHMAGVSTHDTVPPPPEIALMLRVAYGFLPRAATLIFSGSEWGAQLVTNAEFGAMPDGHVPTENELSLFNDIPIDWDGPALRAMPFNQIDRLKASLKDLDSWDYTVLEITSLCFGFRRTSPEAGTELTVLLNFDREPVLLGEQALWIIAGANSPWACGVTTVLPAMSAGVRVSAPRIT